MLRRIGAAPGQGGPPPREQVAGPLTRMFPGLDQRYVRSMYEQANRQRTSRTASNPFDELLEAQKPADDNPFRGLTDAEPAAPSFNLNSAADRIAPPPDDNPFRSMVAGLPGSPVTNPNDWAAQADTPKSAASE